MKTSAVNLVPLPLFHVHRLLFAVFNPPVQTLRIGLQNDVVCLAIATINMPMNACAWWQSQIERSLVAREQVARFKRVVPVRRSLPLTFRGRNKVFVLDLNRKCHMNLPRLLRLRCAAGTAASTGDEPPSSQMTASRPIVVTAAGSVLGGLA